MLKIFRLPLKKWIVSGYRFGDRTDNPRIPVHTGVDLRANAIDGFAPRDGRFYILHENEPDAGMWAILDCGDMDFHFMHLSKVYRTGFVKAGDTIFKTGNSGSNTTAPHLHLGIKISGAWVDPQQVMTNTILLKNLLSHPIDEATKRAVVEFFAQEDINVVFEESEAANLRIWGLMTVSEAGGSWCDTKDTHNTPGYYDMAFGWNSLNEGPNRQPKDIIIHEILHGLYEDRGLADIHDYNFGVADNQKVLELLIKYNSKEMKQIYGDADAKAQYDAGIRRDPPNQYILGDDGKLHLITNGAMLQDLAAAGIVEPVGVKWVPASELNRMTFGRDWAASDNN